jgi:hypothetical protein
MEERLVRPDLSEADLRGMKLDLVDFQDADLSKSKLDSAQLDSAVLDGADLREASLRQANLFGAYLQRADLRHANLRFTNLIDADLTDADLTGSLVFGASAWKVKLDRTKQRDLVITEFGEMAVTVDNIEVAQFVYLLLHNEKIRDVIDTVGKKAVLLLGRFTEGRIVVLERLREELRRRGYVPIVFNFDKPETRDFTETVRLLAGLSRLVIVDVTNPRSAPLELQAIVPEIMVPVRPIIEVGQPPFAMLQDLAKYDWVFPLLSYSSLDALAEALDDKIIKLAEARFVELMGRRAAKMKAEHV